MRRIFIALLAAMMVFAIFSACRKNEPVKPEPSASEKSSVVPSEPVEESSSVVERTKVKFGVLKGPTGIGASSLLIKNSLGVTLNGYEVSVIAEATDMVAEIASGNLDIAALPTNVAASLYNKTQGKVQVIALNTAGVLYILEKGDTIKSISDLKGRKVFATGQGANPEFVFNYILRQNGLEPGTDVEIEYLESAELVTKASAGDVDIVLLPVPAVTTVLVKNDQFRKAISLTEEWDKLDNGSKLTMGCVVVRKEFAENNREAVENFLQEYEQSIKYVTENPKETGAFCETFEIVPSAGVATKAIPDSNLIFVEGKEIKEYLEGYYEVLFEAEPKSIGGALPKDDFYGIG